MVRDKAKWVTGENKKNNIYGLREGTRNKTNTSKKRASISNLERLAKAGVQRGPSFQVTVQNLRKKTHRNGTSRKTEHKRPLGTVRTISVRASPQDETNTENPTFEVYRIKGNKSGSRGFDCIKKTQDINTVEGPTKRSGGTVHKPRRQAENKKDGKEFSKSRNLWSQRRAFCFPGYGYMQQVMCTPPELY